MANINQHVIEKIKEYYPKEYKSYLSQKHVNILPKYLGKNETVTAVLFGKIQDLIGHNKCGLWATDRRLLFLSTHLLGEDFIDYTFDKIESMQIRPSWPRSFILKLTGTRNLNIDFIDTDVAQRFSNHLREKLNKPRRDNSKSSNSSILDDLEKLANLHGKGSLTDEEFRIAKRKLLKEEE